MANPQVSFSQTAFEPGSFWDRRRNVVRSATIPAQLDLLRRTGRYDAFRLQWHPSYTDPPNVWPVPNHLFWDSDVAKWIEGACYFLEKESDPSIDRAIYELVNIGDESSIDGAIEELVEMIQSAQQPDGYLNIHFTVVAPEERFTNLRDLHELYNAGHLIEAALAHQRHYQNDRLLEPIVRYVDLLCRTFGPKPGQLHGYPGHPEIELALIRLYKHTCDHKHLNLARYFIRERGNPTGAEGQHYYDLEVKLRGENENLFPQHYTQKRSYWYQQAHKPILEQETIEGHSVRAMYLLTSVADISLQEPAMKRDYLPALQRLWSNMVEKRMYLSGGIGAIKRWEGFGIDYFLPQGTDEGGGYAETCAAIGVMMLAERLLQLELDSEYADVMELVLYNAVLTGISLNGKGFTYTNHLASSTSDPSKREEWFVCSCCPPNILRLFGTLGGYIWSVTEKISNTGRGDEIKDTRINVHLYTSATLTLPAPNSHIKLTQTTKYPLDGDISFSLSSPPTATCPLTVRLRIPNWVEGSYTLSPPPPPESHLDKGYLTLPCFWLVQNPQWKLSFEVEPRLISPHPFVGQIAAVARGPIVYCVEDVDNPWVDDHFKSTVLHRPSALQGKFYQTMRTDMPGKEPYMAVTLPDGARFLDINSARFNPSATYRGHRISKKTDRQPNTACEPNPIGNPKPNEAGHDSDREGSTGTWDVIADDITSTSRSEQGEEKGEDLVFIPYYARANRGGNGMMRVGLRV